jgi:predicted DNA-binding protein with PD1-like motif
MKSHKTDQGWLLILKKGEDFHSVLNQFASDNNLESAWLSGVGGSGPVELGFYEIERRDYKWQLFEGPLEVVSLTGNLAYIDGEPFWHVHGVFGGRDYECYGGHVKALEVGLTLELNITKQPHTNQRAFDEETGLKIIQ